MTNQTNLVALDKTLAAIRRASISYAASAARVGSIGERIVRAVHEVVPVDVWLPGCPPSADQIFYVLSELAQGRKPELKDDMLQWDWKIYCRKRNLK